MHDDEIPVGRTEDLTNKVFGEWTVLYRTFNTNNGKNVNWKCKCNKCGVEKAVRRDQLLHGKNLGCIHCGTAKARYKNLAGKQIGDLLILEETKERNNGAIVWKCKDINTNKIVYRRTDLIYSYKTNSNNSNNKLNINSMSKGEIVIYLTLKFNNIQFEKQKTFNNCKFLDTNSLAKFDFYINNQYIVEYDGEPHFQEIQFFDGDLLKRKEHDDYKNQWCKENNIPLIRIPYTHINNLCIEDLLLETSQFIIK